MCRAKFVHKVEINLPVSCSDRGPMEPGCKSRNRRLVRYQHTGFYRRQLTVELFIVRQARRIVL